MKEIEDYAYEESYLFDLEAHDNGTVTIDLSSEDIGERINEKLDEEEVDDAIVNGMNRRWLELKKEDEEAEQAEIERQEQNWIKYDLWVKEVLALIRAKYPESQVSKARTTSTYYIWHEEPDFQIRISDHGARLDREKADLDLIWPETDWDYVSARYGGNLASVEPSEDWKEELEDFLSEIEEENKAEGLFEDRAKTMLRNMAKKAGTTYRKVKAKFKDIEKGVARNINKKDERYWPIVVSTLKKAFDINESELTTEDNNTTNVNINKDLKNMFLEGKNTKGFEKRSDKGKEGNLSCEQKDSKKLLSTCYRLKEKKTLTEDTVKKSMNESLQNLARLWIVSNHQAQKTKIAKKVENWQVVEKFHSYIDNPDISSLEPIESFCEGKDFHVRVRVDDSNWRLIYKAMILDGDLFLYEMTPYDKDKDGTYKEILEKIYSDKILFTENESDVSWGDLKEVHYKDLYGGEHEEFEKKYKKRKSEHGIYVQFTNHQGDVLEKKPYENPDHSDPAAIYGYPLKYVIDYPADVWYGQKAKFLRVLEIKPSTKVLNLNDMSQNEAETLLRRMGFENAGELLKKARKNFKFRVGTGKNAWARAFWQVMQVEDLDEVERPKLRSATEQNALLRKAGFDAFEDKARSDKQAVVNEREPEQIGFLHRGAFDVVDLYRLSQTDDKGALTTNHPDHLSRKHAAIIAKEVLGDSLSSDEAETSGLMGKQYFWTKDGRRIEIEFERPQSYYKDKTMGQKKHRGSKKANEWTEKITVRTELGDLTLWLHQDSMFSPDPLRQDWEKLKENPKETDWKPQSKDSYLQQKKVEDEKAREELRKKESEKEVNYMQKHWNEWQKVAHFYGHELVEPQEYDEWFHIFKMWDRVRNLLERYEGDWKKVNDYFDKPHAQKLMSEYGATIPLYNLLRIVNEKAKSKEAKEVKTAFWILKDIEEQSQKEESTDWGNISRKFKNEDWGNLKEVAAPTRWGSEVLPYEKGKDLASIVVAKEAREFAKALDKALVKEPQEFNDYLLGQAIERAYSKTPSKSENRIEVTSVLPRDRVVRWKDGELWHFDYWVVIDEKNLEDFKQSVKELIPDLYQTKLGRKAEETEWGNLKEDKESERELRKLASIYAEVFKKKLEKIEYQGKDIQTLSTSILDDYQGSLAPFLRDFKFKIKILPKKKEGEKGMESNVAGSWIPEKKELQIYSNLVELIRNKDPKLRASNIALLTKIIEDVLVHELVHVYDDYRSKGKFIGGYKDVAQDEKAYLTHPAEVNARYLEAIRASDKERLKITSEPKKQWYLFLNEMMRNFRGWDLLSDEQTKRLTSKAYDDFYNLEEPEQVEAIKKYFVDWYASDLQYGDIPKANNSDPRIKIDHQLALRNELKRILQKYPNLKDGFDAEMAFLSDMAKQDKKVEQALIDYFNLGENELANLYRAYELEEQTEDWGDLAESQIFFRLVRAVQATPGVVKGGSGREYKLLDRGIAVNKIISPMDFMRAKLKTQREDFERIDKNRVFVDYRQDRNKIVHVYALKYPKMYRMDNTLNPMDTEKIVHVAAFLECEAAKKYINNKMFGLHREEKQIEEGLEIKDIKWSYPTDEELEKEFREEDVYGIFFKGYPKKEEEQKAFEYFRNNLEKKRINPEELVDDNAWRFDFSDYKSLRDQVKKYADPKDPDSMIRKIQAGGELPMPVAIKRDGKFMLAGGATRVALAKLANQDIDILIFNPTEWVEKQARRVDDLLSKWKIQKEQVSNPCTEIKDNPDHKYHTIPKDSQVLKEGKKFGIDIAGRKVYQIGKKYYSWDGQHGEWEVFSSRLNHLGAVWDYGQEYHKPKKKDRHLQFRTKL